MSGGIPIMKEQKIMLESTTATKDVKSAIKFINQPDKCDSKGLNDEDLDKIKRLYGRC